MESAIDSQYPILDADGIDFDSILQDFPVDFDLDLWLSPPQLDEGLNSPKESENSESLSSFANEIEKFLMEDGDEVLGQDGDKRVDEFLSDILVDGSGSGSDCVKSDVASPESARSADSEVAGEREEEEDDQMRKKRRRRIRNKEFAMQSRERKKMYVKDLEMKSKYLESECRRLDHALRCCQAENFALHQRLQKGGSLAAKQESAVLFVGAVRGRGRGGKESLLLGSLFWLVSIVFLFLVPGLQTPSPKGGSRLGRGLALEDVGSKTAESKRSRTDTDFEWMIMRRRRYRGLRARMKSFFMMFPFYGLSAHACFSLYLIYNQTSIV